MSEMKHKRKRKACCYVMVQRLGLEKAEEQEDRLESGSANGIRVQPNIEVVKVFWIE